MSNNKFIDELYEIWKDSSCTPEASFRDRYYDVLHLTELDGIVTVRMRRNHVFRTSIAGGGKRLDCGFKVVVVQADSKNCEAAHYGLITLPREARIVRVFNLRPDGSEIID